METMTCIEDLRQAASRKVPRAFFDFVDGGSYTERTLQANCADFERIKLRQRVLIDVANRGTRSDDPRRARFAAVGAGSRRALRHAASRR